MRMTLLLLLALAACAAPASEDDAPSAIPSGPTLSMGGGIGNYFGTSR